MLMNKENQVFTYIGKGLNLKKEGNLAIHNINELGGHYAK